MMTVRQTSHLLQRHCEQPEPAQWLQGALRLAPAELGLKWRQNETAEWDGFLRGAEILKPDTRLSLPPEARCIEDSIDIHRSTMYSAAMLTKELVAASTEPLILSLLSDGESYGYGLIQEVKRLSRDKIEWTDGMLYPVLHRMERRGLIKSRWEEKESGRKRKYYSIKSKGKTAMAAHHEQWSLVHGVLASLRKELYV